MPKEYKKIALVVGGLSAEREVSLSTGKAFESALQEMKLPYQLIDAKEDFPRQLMDSKADVALIALHGKYGEDGTVQGICEYLKIPYSTCGVLASALCMDKFYSKQIYVRNQIPTPDFELIDMRVSKADQVKTRLSFPVVTKPSREGSSVGVSICRNQEEFRRGLALAAQSDYEVLVEDFIEGMELTVPILAGRVLTPIEIVPKTSFYDYQRKYSAGATEYVLPARLPQKTLELAKEYTLMAWQACRVRVYARMDFRVNQQGVPLLMEINTQPGCTPTSLLPKSAAHDGIKFTQVISTLLQEASLDYAGVR